MLTFYLVIKDHAFRNSTHGVAVSRSLCLEVLERSDDATMAYVLYLKQTKP